MVDQERRLNFYQRFTYGVVSTTESFFYKLGVKVGSNPINTILICWAIVLLSALGGFRFYQEKNPLKLWVPPESTFAKDTEWLMKTLELGFRKEVLILTAPNVLVPEVIIQLLEIHEQVQKAKSIGNITWSDVCFKLPKVDRGLAKMLARETDNGKNDLTATMDVTMLCSFYESIPLGCFHQSLLELWNYNRKEIENLTTEKIIERLNNHDEMLFMGQLKNYSSLLGYVQKNESGHIIAAGALQNVWMTKVNFSAVDMDKVGNMAGTGDWVSEEAFEWELEFEAVMTKMKKILPNEMNLYFASGRTFGDITSKTMFQDMDKILMGGVIMGIYVLFVISRMNFLEIRVALCLQGLMSVGMSFVVGCGICFLIGIPYGPVHTSLPFLLMGLGVDDMFVIIACYDDLTSDQKRKPIPEVLGLMLKHAGVSITITSVTDILAFIIGSSTIIPNLQSYCIYAAVCVLMTFVFAVTFFCACFALDQKRIESNINGIIPCIKHEAYKPNSCSQKQISNRTFHFIFDDIVLSVPGKIIVIIVTIVLAVVIDIEVLRNLQLALLAVMVCTLLLVADIQTCFWIFICVLLSMVNVCGFMQMWGLTIDLVSCIGLELAIGLCVDYATHIGHTFLTIDGTRRDRALKTVTAIGSAVVYGGLSTLIGVLMLLFSEAYIFKAFFKIFLLVITFGLFHGVIVMPVILSMIGPKPYSTLHKKENPMKEEEMVECIKPKLRDSIGN